MHKKTQWLGVVFLIMTGFVHAGTPVTPTSVLELRLFPEKNTNKSVSVFGYARRLSGGYAHLFLTKEHAIGIDFSSYVVVFLSEDKDEKYCGYVGCLNNKYIKVYGEFKYIDAIEDFGIEKIRRIRIKEMKEPVDPFINAEKTTVEK